MCGFQLYKKTIFPLLLVLSGGCNHLLVLAARWIFLKDEYGMSSRYEIQYQMGIVGILLTFALVWSMCREKAQETEADKAKTRAPEKRAARHTFKGLYAGIYRADGLWKCMDNPGRNPDSAVPESIFTGIKGAGTELPDGER